MQYINLIGQNCFHCPNLWKSKVIDKSANDFTATLLLILQSVFNYNQLISTKKETSSLCKLYSVYDDKPEEFLDKIDVDSYLYLNALDNSQSQNRVVRVSKGSNKKSFAFKVFHFCDSKLQQRCIFKEEISISKTEIGSLLDSLGDFLKVFDQANKISQFPLSKPKLEIGFTKAKDEMFSHCYKDIVEHLNTQFRLWLQFEKHKTCVVSIKKFEHYGVQSILTEVVNLGYREIEHLYKNRFLLPTSVTIMRAITMCSAFTPDCGYDNSTTILIGDVYCPNTKCLGKLCLHKKTFQSLGRSDYQCPQCGFVCQVRNIPVEDQTNSFFLSIGPGVYTFLKRAQNQFQMLLEMCIVLASIVSIEKNANILVVM